MTNNLACITLPPALQGQLEVLAASFGVDEEQVSSAVSSWRRS
jgi:hypothetical protein